MEEMVSQLSVMVEDLKVERRYALSTLAARRIREAADAVELAKRLVSVAVNAGESAVRRRMDDALLSRAALRAEDAVGVDDYHYYATVAAGIDHRAETYIRFAEEPWGRAATVATEADHLAEAYIRLAEDAVGAAEDAVGVDDYYATLPSDPGIKYDCQSIR